MTKEKFNIKRLRPVEDILENDLICLDYSTQKRNAAYLIQHLEFLQKLHGNYHIYGSIQSMYLHQVVIVLHMLVESIIYSILKKEKLLPSSSRSGHVKFMKMIDSAKKTKNAIIGKDIYLKLKILNDLRNSMHPEKQTKLHANFFDTSLINEQIETYGLFMNAVYRYYGINRNSLGL